MSRIAITPRAQVKRIPQRGCYDREVIDAILDEGFICHVAFPVDGQARVIPTLYARAGDAVYIHGAVANQMLRAIEEEGIDTSLCVTHVDGLVLARSAFHHSLNFRSVILFGRATPVTDETEKLAALRSLVEHTIPDRWRDVRSPNDREMKQTRVLRIPIEEGSAKVRTGPPVDDEEDYALECWAGVIPLATRALAPVPDARLRKGIEAPGYARNYRRPVNRG